MIKRIPPKITAFLLTIALVASVLTMFISAQSPTYNKLDSWLKQTGSQGSTEVTDAGLRFTASGAHNLLCYYYADKFNSLDGFDVTLGVDSIGTRNDATHDSRISFILTSKQDASTIFGDNSGMFLFFQPQQQAGIYNVNLLVNDGTGLAGSTVSATSIDLGGGEAMNINLYKEPSGDGNWHIFINGADIGADLSSVKSLLDQGAFFGLEAYENGTGFENQSIAVTLKSINGVGMGNVNKVNADTFIKSAKSNVSSDASILFTSDGVVIEGTSPNANYQAFKFGYGTPVINLDGFTTSFTLDNMAGYHGTDGVDCDIDFALTTFNGTGIDNGLLPGAANPDRLDIWDYYDNPVASARGVHVRMQRTSSTDYSAALFIAGSDGKFQIPTDVISASAFKAINGKINITLIKVANDWRFIVNGINILNETDVNKLAAFNAELDSLSTNGATAVLAAGYNNFGSPAVVPNVKITLSQLNGRQLSAAPVETTVPVTNPNPNTGDNMFIAFVLVLTGSASLILLRKKALIK